MIKDKTMKETNRKAEDLLDLASSTYDYKNIFKKMDELYKNIILEEQDFESNNFICKAALAGLREIYIGICDSIKDGSIYKDNPLLKAGAEIGKKYAGVDKLFDENNSNPNILIGKRFLDKGAAYTDMENLEDINSFSKEFLNVGIENILKELHEIKSSEENSLIRKVELVYEFLSLYKNNKLEKYISDTLLSEKEPEKKFFTIIHYDEELNIKKILNENLIRVFYNKKTIDKYFDAEHLEKYLLAYLWQDSKIQNDDKENESGRIYLIYKLCKNLDFPKFCYVLDCTKDFYMNIEMSIYNYTFNNQKSIMQELVQASMDNITQSDEAETKSYKNFVYTKLLCFALRDIFKTTNDNDADEVYSKIDSLIKNNTHDLEPLNEILNSLAVKLGFNCKNSKLFNLKSFEKNYYEKSKFSGKLIFANLLYMLIHYDSPSKEYIYHEINFIREQQLERFNVIPKKYLKYEKTAAKEEIQKIKNNRNMLEKIDFGFDINYLQQDMLFEMFNVKPFKRHLTCKMFREVDRHIINIHKYSDETNDLFKLNYDENLRLSNRKHLTNYYLYLDRNINTHYDNLGVISSLLDDSKSKKNLIEALDDILCFWSSEMRNNKDENLQKNYRFVINRCVAVSQRIVQDIVPEIRFIDLTDPEEFRKKVQQAINFVFEEKYDNEVKEKRAYLKKDENVRRRVQEYSLEQKLMEKYPEFYDLLKSSLEMAYCVDPDFINKYKLQVVIYLMYLTCALTSPEEMLKKQK